MENNLDTESMKFILKYYGDMRETKTEDSALRACFKKISDLELGE